MYFLLFCFSFLLLSDDGSVNLFKLRESLTAQHSLRFALLNCRMVIFFSNFVFIFLCWYKRGKNASAQYGSSLDFKFVFVVKSPKNYKLKNVF